MSQVAEAATWRWHVARAGAWALLVVFPAWFTSVHVLGDVSTVNAADLESRWSSPVVRVLDWAVLVLALVHGAAGLGSLLRSGRSGGRRLAVVVLDGSVAVLVLAVTVVAFTYGIA